jgi:prevent-host-death family protein
LTIHFACVILKHMKSVSLRHMQHHLSDVMRHVDQGQEVLVTRRRRTIARLVPMQPATARVKWPDFAARTTLIKGPPLSTTILADRE